MILKLETVKFQGLYQLIDFESLYFVDFKAVSHVQVNAVMSPLTGA